MLDDLAQQLNGRELAVREEIAPGEVGVEFASGNTLALYAFPDHGNARAFETIALHRVVYQTGKIGIGKEFFFEDVTRD